ncbi:FAD/NAD(P)-binding protein [Microbacterium betulae]|uniref:FAD/NAD(P)-binding protein n=1 Tax=Microbacterium betulae TaxID=2981139 RepID=A0AA97FDW8_9MICO|nr:FAD/NAD(P)-binding protein [Microbacterium sp. AB]WOF21761.1 FAD/NAD(P)-binding protein [Microbacterium sp. AB]
MSAPRRPVIAIVGGGPRGVSLLERLGANLPADAAIDIRIVDDTEVGAGRIWRTDQTRELCMNTLADAVTLFTDDAATVAGPVRVGPTLHEWCQLVRQRAFGDADDVVAHIPATHVAAFDRVPVREGLAREYGSELRAQRPESHPSRSLYGEYARWCLAYAEATLPPGARATEHLGRVTAVSERDGMQVLEVRTTAGTEELEADAVVAATGWLERSPTPEEREIRAAVDADPALVWVRPGSPVDQPLGAVPDGAHAIVRGLGMGFFDAVALLTRERGGRFVAEPAASSGLRYEASGREPVLHVTSRRGVPFRAKTLYGSLPPRAPMRHLRSVDWAGVPRPIDFDDLVWPLVLKDAFADYHETLAHARPGSVDLDGALRAISHADLEAVGAATRERVERLADAVSPFVPDPADRLDLASAMFPGEGRTWPSPGAFDAWVARFVAGDLAASAQGSDSPVKAALWSIASARGLVGRIGAFGGFDAESRASGFRTLMSVGAMAGSGPPAFRNRQLLALRDAGIVRFLGPAAHVTIAEGAFHASSSAVAGSGATASVLIDAWMHVHDVAESADPLVRSLAAAARLRPFDAPARAGGGVGTGAFDVDPATGRLIRADGSVDAAFHVSGIPIEQAMHDAVISPMPRTDPTMLRETDRVARSLITAATSPVAGRRRPA